MGLARKLKSNSTNTGLVSAILPRMAFCLATLLAASFILQSSCASALAAGFDCGRAKSKLEKTICKNRDLNSADEAMSKLYTELRKQLRKDAASTLLNEQRAWLYRRANECDDGDARCLSEAYRKRIEELQLKVSSVRKNYTSWVGRYLSAFKVELYDAGNPHEIWVEDCLAVRSISDREIKFQWEAYGDNAHLCLAEGTARRRGPREPYVWRDDSIAGCEVTLFPEAERIVLTATGECKDLCGALAYLMDTDFTRSQIVDRGACPMSDEGRDQ